MNLLKTTRQFALSCLLTLSLTATAMAMPSVHISGQTLKDDQGRTVILHGLNEMNKQAPYTPSAIGFDARNMQFLEAHGFNLVRLGIFWAAIEPTPGHYNDAYLSSIAKTIRQLAQHHIYTIVDFHQDGFSTKDGYGAGEPVWVTRGTGSDYTPGFPASYLGGTKYFGKTIGLRLDDNFTVFWNNNELQLDYANMTKHVVQFFDQNNLSSIIGYEVMNEPFVGLGWSSTGNIDQYEATALNEFSTLIASSIHQVNPMAPVWYEPDVSFDTGHNTAIGSINANSVGFSFHDYDTAHLSVPIDNAVNYQSANHVPLIMTEFGASELSPALLTKILDLADSHQISWTEWAYSNNPNFKFIRFAGDPRAQGIVYDLKKPLTGSNVNWKRLDVLARPYPEYIAGNNIQFKLDAQKHTLILSYDINQSQSGHAQITSISIPDNIAVQSIDTHNVTNVRVKQNRYHLLFLNTPHFKKNATAFIRITYKTIIQQ